MRKYNLTLLIALTFISNATQILGSEGGDFTKDFSDCGTGIGAGTGTGTSTGTGTGTETGPVPTHGGAGGGAVADMAEDALDEAAEGVAVSFFPTDEEIEAHGQEMKRAYLTILMSALAWVKKNLTTVVDSEMQKSRARSLVMLQQSLWDQCKMIDRKTGLTVFNEKKFNTLAVKPPFTSFHSLDTIVSDISHVKMIISIENGFAISLPSKFVTHVRKTRIDKQTTLLLGCGRESSCENHKGRANPHHYTVDCDSQMGPDIIGDVSGEDLWSHLEAGKKFQKVIAEGLLLDKDILLMRKILNILEPGGVFLNMHTVPRFYQKGNTLTQDADLFSGWRDATGRPLVEMSIGKFLTEHVGFERIEFTLPQDDRWEAYQGVPQLHAFKRS